MINNSIQIKSTPVFRSARLGRRVKDNLGSFTMIKKPLSFCMLLFLSMSNLLHVQSAQAHPRLDHAESLVTELGGLPVSTMIATPAEWEKALEAAPAWTGYPQVDGMKTVDKLGEIVEYEITKSFTPKNPQDVAPESALKGYSPRNLQVNRTLHPFDSFREAMPENLATPSRTLTHVDGSLRAEVVEWLNTRYKKELKHPLTSEEALALVHAKGITYENLWFQHPKSELNYTLQFDDQGRPLNPSPLVEKNGVAGNGFYFRLGQNLAVDIMLTFEDEDRLYIVMNRRNDGEFNLAFPAGMVDLSDENELATGFREVAEETGINLDFPRIKTEGKATLYWAGTVAGEARATRNAWTDSRLYHIHFNSIEELKSYTRGIHSRFDRQEIASRYILSLGFVLENYLMPTGADHGKMFASHGSMLSFGLAQFLYQHPEKIRFLTPQGDLDFKSSRMSFKTLREKLLSR